MRILVFALFMVLWGRTGAQEKDLTVYIFMAEECPVCMYIAKDLAAAAAEFGDKVSFNAVFPLRNSNYKKIHLFKQTNGLQAYTSILDKEHDLVRKYSAQVTPEAVIINRDNEILYRGRVTDAYFAPGRMKHGPRKNELKEVLKLLLAGKHVVRPWPRAIGCYITPRKS